MVVDYQTRINKMLSPNNLGFIDVNRTVTIEKAHSLVEYFIKECSHEALHLDVKIS